MSCHQELQESNYARPVRITSINFHPSSWRCVGSCEVQRRVQHITCAAAADDDDDGVQIGPESDEQRDGGNE